MCVRACMCGCATPNIFDHGVFHSLNADVGLQHLPTAHGQQALCQGRMPWVGMRGHKIRGHPLMFPVRSTTCLQNCASVVRAAVGLPNANTPGQPRAKCTMPLGEAPTGAFSDINHPCSQDGITCQRRLPLLNALVQLLPGCKHLKQVSLGVCVCPVTFGGPR